MTLVDHTEPRQRLRMSPIPLPNRHQPFTSSKE